MTNSQTNEEIAKRMTAHQVASGQALRDVVEAQFAMWLASWANRTGYGVLDHVKRRARFDTSHTAIARHQQ